MSYLPLNPEQTEFYHQRLHDAREGVHFTAGYPGHEVVADVISKLVIGERKLAAPHGLEQEYDDGAATQDNEIFVEPGERGIIITTEHATSHVRTSTKTGKKRVIDAEYGLAGLGSVTAGELSAYYMTMLGRQTGDPNHDLRHPFKNRLTNLLASSGSSKFLSVHGMKSGRVTRMDEDRGYDVAVGIGDEPTTETENLGEKLVASAKELGLKAGINVPFLHIVERDEGLAVRVNEDGAFFPRVFAAAGERTTRRTAELFASERGQNLAAVQIEIADTLRLSPPNLLRSLKVATTGPYLGHLLLSKALSTC